jgi:predicted lipoprotein with Yx(FWY)xxD motif
VVSVIVGLTLLTGCDAAPDPAPPRPAAAQAQVREVVRSVTVNAAEVPGLGPVLTDQDGHTLYLFTKDSPFPPRSTCVLDCARKWPPLLVTGNVQLSGVEQRLVGTVRRPDGETQLTVAGWPVYTSAQDTAPGQAKGQGAQDAWFAVSPEGRKTGTPELVALAATDIPDFGAALTDADGRTLYLFTNDSKDPPRSTCDGECAANWPPVRAIGDRIRLTGVDLALVGRFTREDGTEQVTVGGWPVHTYVEDTAPGQTNGHGAGGMWFVIEAAGCRSAAPVRQAPAADEPDGSTGY